MDSKDFSTVPAQRVLTSYRDLLKFLWNLLESVGILWNTVKPGFSKRFEKSKIIYYCQVLTIYHVLTYGVIANFGKQQKVY